MHSVLGTADSSGERLRGVGELRKILSQTHPNNYRRKVSGGENKSAENQLVLLRNGHGAKRHSKTAIAEQENAMEEVCSNVWD